MTLMIYGVLRSRARRCIWLAMELGIPFAHVPVIQAHRLQHPDRADATLTTESQEFLAINPNGRVPAIDDDGFRMHESMAINIYLARKHGGPLAPANEEEGGLAAMWALWAATECEQPAIAVYRQRHTYPPDKRDEAEAEKAVRALRKPLAVLEKALAKDGFVMGGRFSVADINVSEIVRYALPAGELFDDLPNVKGWIAACAARPAWQAMMRQLEAEPA
jgi:glutathione S-transferase